MYESLEEEFTRRAEAAQAIYKKLAARQKEKSGQDGLEPVPMSYSEETGNVATIVSDNARFADLTVLIMPSVDVDARIVETAETVLFESGRPILFIPADLQTIAAENVVIGWDGSPHATRAGVDAIPFLLTAKNVAILTIASDADDHQNPDRFRNMLKRHGVSAALETIENADDDAGQVLLKVAESGMADLLVMGGYGKHPIREFIFGGATRTILNNAPIPILMSH